MTTIRQQATAPVLVGVDLSAGAADLAIWAARTAASRHRDLVLVHVPATGATSGSGLDDVLATVRRAVPAVPARSRTVGGPTEAALVAASREACLLVLGSHGRADFTHSARGSLGYRVAMRSHCPVVVVPPGTGHTEVARIVVGVAFGPAARWPVRFAADEAVCIGATLLLAAAESSTDRDAEELDSLVERLAITHPGLTVDTVCRAGTAAELLLQHAGPDALIVVGCHHVDERFSARLGDVPTAVLARTACPVVLVGHG